jgi:hypothetical protein
MSFRERAAQAMAAWSEDVGKARTVVRDASRDVLSRLDMAENAMGV